MLPEYKNFLLDVNEEGFAVLTVNRPEARNAMTPEAWKELNAFLEYVEECDQIRAIILTGSGDKAFVAGADLKSMGSAGKSRPFGLKDPYKPAVTHIEKCIKPVICAVNGVAFGGGFEMAMACDIRVVAENAKFALPEVGLGIIPGLGGTQRLARLIGVGRAKEIVLMNRKVGAQEAVSIGLATACVPQEQLMDKAMEVARTITANSPSAIAMCKQLISLSMSTDQNVGEMMESYGFSLALQSDDKAEGVRAFLEKRKPSFKSI